MIRRCHEATVTEQFIARLLPDKELNTIRLHATIQDMKNVIVILLKKFFEKNDGRKPERLIMFRDGVSEGQFLTVLAQEVMAMRAACRQLEEGYEPPITYFVVQKRHHTRFFPADNNKYRNGNALAGTVVDQGMLPT